MDWIRTHPYHLALACGVLLLLIGAFLIRERSAVTPLPSSNTSWGSTGVGLLDLIGSSASKEDGAELRDLYRNIQSGPPFTYIPYTPQDTSNENVEFDFDAFIALLSNKDGGANSPNELDDSLLTDTYSLIPRGLIVSSTSDTELTAGQQVLYEYGNSAGSYIQSFEERNADMAGVLKDQFEDPEDPVKNASLRGLAEGMASVGRSLEGLDGIPQVAKEANARLAGSYKEMSAKLALIPEAHTETALLGAIVAYNNSVEGFIKNYVALATLFSLSEVTFRPEEAGSVFMFSGNSL